jgi:hypothetical protein
MARAGLRICDEQLDRSAKITAFSVVDEHLSEIALAQKGSEEPSEGVVEGASYWAQQGPVGLRRA